MIILRKAKHSEENYEIIKPEFFPNGELKIPKTLRYLDSYSEVILKYENDIDIMMLYFLKKSNMLDGVKKLIIPYLPYSRMDRENEDYLFTLKYFGRFINDLKFSEVRTLDVHSNTAFVILNYLENENIAKLLSERYIERTSKSKIYFPDQGAVKRYLKRKEYEEKDFLFGEKQRDFKTGKIVSTKIIGDLEDCQEICIIDDLCSRGGTFLEAAKQFKERGVKKVHLATAHCENNVYSGELLTSGLIDTFVTTDSILNYDESKDPNGILKVVPCLNFI